MVVMLTGAEGRVRDYRQDPTLSRPWSTSALWRPRLRRSRSSNSPVYVRQPLHVFYETRCLHVEKIADPRLQGLQAKRSYPKRPPRLRMLSTANLSGQTVSQK